MTDADGYSRQLAQGATDADAPPLAF
jgi:hypothetical protein